jgi:hypothetical protein
LALDQFLMVNSIYLVMSNSDMEKMAQTTASYKERGENHQVVKRAIATVVSHSSFEFRIIRRSHPKRYREFHRTKNAILKFPLNEPGTRPQQR